MNETDIQSRILNVLRRLTFLRADRYNSGKLPNPEGQLVSFGTTGCADIQACVAPTGRLLGLEVKRPGEVQTPAQLAWAADIVSKGGFAFRVDNLDDACEHALNTYRENLLLLKRAGDLTIEQMLELVAKSDAEMAAARQAAEEVEERRGKRKNRMPKRKALPPGTNSGAKF
jgi:hypothetical protein